MPGSEDAALGNSINDALAAVGHVRHWRSMEDAARKEASVRTNAKETTEQILKRLLCQPTLAFSGELTRDDAYGIAALVASSGALTELDLRRPPFCLRPDAIYREGTAVSVAGYDHAKHLYLYRTADLLRTANFSAMAAEARAPPSRWRPCPASGGNSPTIEALGPDGRLVVAPPTRILRCKLPCRRVPRN